MPNLPIMLNGLKQRLGTWIGADKEGKPSPQEIKLKQKILSLDNAQGPLFDEDFYLRQNPDLIDSGLDPFWHYLHKGGLEGRAPSAQFDGAYYLEIYEDVRKLGINPLVHYVEYGAEENRTIRRETDEFANELISYFDPAYYLETYPDVAAAGLKPLTHFLHNGWVENRNPSATFDTLYYLNTYSDARVSGLDPLTHYVTAGRGMGYLTSPSPTAAQASASAEASPQLHANQKASPKWVLRELAFERFKGAGIAVETFEAGVVSGVAHLPSTPISEIELMAEKRVLRRAQSVNNNSLADDLGLPTRSGFLATLPLQQGYDNLSHLRIRFRGQPSTERPLDWRGRVSPQVLYVANSGDPNDGSRIYRADLAALQLKESGIDAVVLGQEELVKQAHVRILNPDTFDVIIFQRVPATSSILNILKQGRSKGRRILYDVDDLMFKPWRRAEMGIIRSGVVKFEDENYAEGLRKRLELLTLSDGVICSTPFLQRELNSLGVPSILSRNAVDDRNFVHGALRLAREPAQGLRIMFMSGTPTHEADFNRIKDVLKDVLQHNPQVTFTILGELRNTELDGLTNVVRMAAVPRQQMFRIISEQDLVLVPLERTAFNLAKSSLKFMECGAAGVPVIASDLFEFERDIRFSGAGMIARTLPEWRRSIQAYVDNPALSREHGLKAFQYCLDRYSVSSRKGFLWNEICRFDEYLIQCDELVQNISGKLKTAGY